MNFKKFHIDELFVKIKTPSLGVKAGDLPETPTGEYNTPALTAGIQNQGLSRYVKKDMGLKLKNVISVSANGANSGVMFYQPHDFVVLQDAYAIKWKDIEYEPDERIYLYLVATLQKVIRGSGNYSWTNKAGWERIKNVEIELPVDNDGHIDFDYMKERIRELELARIRELEAYLKVTELSDYQLTVEEKAMLDTSREREREDIDLSD